MNWLKKKVILWCLKDFYGIDFETAKLSPRQRIVAYHEVYGVENFQLLLNKHIISFIKKAGLTSATLEEIWFARGAIFFGQTLTNNIKRSHEEWCKIQEENNRK